MITDTSEQGPTVKIDKQALVIGSLGAVALVVCCFLLIAFAQCERGKTDRATCTSHLRQIGQAIQLYIVDNDGLMPTVESWTAGSISALPRLKCPAAEPIPHLDPPLPDTAHKLAGYAFNIYLENTAVVNGRFVREGMSYSGLIHPATTIAIFDYTSGIAVTDELDLYKNSGGWPQTLTKGWQRHNGGGNYLFCDGHVGWFLETDILPHLPDICKGDPIHPSFCTD